MAASGTPSVAVYCLGGFSMTVDGRPVEQLGDGVGRHDQTERSLPVVDRGQVLVSLLHLLGQSVVGGAGVEWSHVREETSL